MESPKYSLNKEDLKSIGRGALMAVGGALVVYLMTIVPHIDLGPTWTPIAVAVASIVLNSLKKYFSGQAQ